MVLFGYLRTQEEGRSVEAPACEEGNPYSRRPYWQPAYRYLAVSPPL